jgi:hypothetical protein
MITVQMDKQSSIAILEPHGTLSKEDFKSVSNIIDPYIDQHGQLVGLIIHTKDFPGWDSFAALCSHLKFVKEHHRKISYLAISTNSVIGNFAEIIAIHFVNAEIKKFSFEEIEQAKKWMATQKV